MPTDERDPMPLAELRAKVEAMDLDALKSTHIISPGYELWANLTEVLSGDGRKIIGRGRCIGMLPIPWADGLAAIRNNAERLIAAAERLERVEAAAWAYVNACDRIGATGAQEAATGAYDALRSALEAK